MSCASIGANPEAARNAGIRINRHILFVMMISGGLAGLAGMGEVAGVTHRLMYGISPGYGLHRHYCSLACEAESSWFDRGFCPFWRTDRRGI